MSQTYFSKLDENEKQVRLKQISQMKGEITVWLKGHSTRKKISVIDYISTQTEILLDKEGLSYPEKSEVLFSFKLKGMEFFCSGQYLTSIAGMPLIKLSGHLFKAERRASYRLLTYPIYQVNAIFTLSQSYEGGNVRSIKTGTSQTGVFKNFLKLVQKNQELVDGQILKIRVQDLSVTGLSIQIGDLEYDYFKKDEIFKDVLIEFDKETFIVPEVKVVYSIKLSEDAKALKKYKVGMHFEKSNPTLDDQLGRKINELLRQVDSNKDFENYLK